MTPFRAFQLAIAGLILAAHIWVVQVASSSPGDGAHTASGASGAAAFAPTADNHEGDSGPSDNDDGDNGATDNDGSLSRMAEPICSTPGEETSFASANQRIVVRVFPPTRPPVRVEIRPVFDLLSIPLPPGQLVGLLVYDVVAGICEADGARLTPIRVLPAEVNLSFRYTDVETLGLDEGRLEIGHLDFATVQWTRVEKQQQDAAGNVIAATVTQTGYYSVYQR